MNFFTPALILRAGSPDAAVADAAQAEWDRVGDDYLDSIARLPLPRGAKLLTRRLSLHDARLVMAGVRKDRLTLSLLFKTADGEWVGLLYKLVQPPTNLRHPELAEPCPVEWLYDEFGSETVDGKLAFTHSILFTDGTELKLVFRDLLVRKYGTVIVPEKEAGLESLLVG